MPTGVHTQDRVPDKDVDTVVAGYEAEGATVTKKRNADGTWEVMATYPGGKSGGRDRQ